MTSTIAFLLYAILPLIAWIYWVRYKINKVPFVALIFITICAGSLLYICAVWLVAWDLKRVWDPDGNGVLDNPTPEMEMAMKEWASDTGRSFAPIAAVPFTIIWVLLNFVILGAFTGILSAIIFYWRKASASSRTRQYPDSSSENASNND